MVTPIDRFDNPSGLIPRVRLSLVQGGAAGAHTLTGIAIGDKILSVIHLTLTLTEAAPNTTNLWTPVDLTSEFEGSAAVGVADKNVPLTAGRRVRGVPGDRVAGAPAEGLELELKNNR